MARAEPRSRFVIIDPPITTLPRRRLADDLRAAIGAGEVELRFQPQVALADDRISGVEVLARWRHGRLGELGAEQLFAAAARANLLPELSRHIHASALTAVGRWPVRLGALGVAINVTGGDLADERFVDRLLGQAADAGVAPVRLTLEITEHELIADLARAAALLADVRTAGAKVALDDFGTGYSGLAYLKGLPVDTVKIDGRLSRDLLGSARDQVVVRHVIAMARELGLGLIAEGVEEEAHRASLAAAGATHYQGFLCAGPLDADGLIRLVEER